MILNMLPQPLYYRILIHIDLVKSIHIHPKQLRSNFLSTPSPPIAFSVCPTSWICLVLLDNNLLKLNLSQFLQPLDIRLHCTRYLSHSTLPDFKDVVLHPLFGPSKSSNSNASGILKFPQLSDSSHQFPTTRKFIVSNPVSRLSSNTNRILFFNSYTKVFIDTIQ